MGFVVAQQVTQVTSQAVSSQVAFLNLHLCPQALCLIRPISAHCPLHFLEPRGSKDHTAGSPGFPPPVPLRSLASSSTPISFPPPSQEGGGGAQEGVIALLQLGRRAGTQDKRKTLWVGNFPLKRLH